MTHEPPDRQPLGHRIKRYILWMLVASDQWLNALLLGFPDETLSSRAARGRQTHWYWGGLCQLLDWLEPGHCRRALESEQAGRHRPEALRPVDSPSTPPPPSPPEPRRPDPERDAP